MKYTKQEYNWIMSLQRRQRTMLKQRDDALLFLYRSCDTQEQKDLLKDLIIRFNCFDEEIYNLALNGMAEYIYNLGYNADEIAVVAFAHDSEADSSQEVLQDIKVPLARLFDQNIHTVNRFDRIRRTYNRAGIKHFIAIDEFSGTGGTLINRYNEFCDLKIQDATIDFCLIASMQSVLDLAQSNGISLHVEYTMKKGLSDYYEGDVLTVYTQSMKSLENKLAEQIGEQNLCDYTFGFGRSESLYSKLYGNIPNNVFPIFWWKQDLMGRKRKTMFDRVQDGY